MTPRHHTGRHALQRVRLYYKVDASLEDIQQLNRDIRNRKVSIEFITRVRHGCKALWVEFKGARIKVIYSPQTEEIITVLHPNHLTSSSA